MARLIRTFCDASLTKTFYIPGNCGSWKQELTMILMQCPDFPGDDPSVFAKLFGKPNFNCIFRILKGVLAGKKLKAHHLRAAYRSTAISEELLKDGFYPFDPYSRGEQNEEQNSQLSETDGLFTMGPPRKKQRVVENVTVDNCVEWLSENRNNLIAISEIAKPFTPKEFQKYMAQIMPKLKALNCFALLGLSSVSHKSQNDVKSVLEGTVLMQWYKSPSFNLSRDVKRLQTLLENNLGLSQEDIFKTCEFLTTPQNHSPRYLTKTRCYNKHKFKEYTKEETQQIHQACEQMAKRGDSIIKPIDISDILENSEGLLIKLRDDFDLGEINTIAVLMGSSPNNVQLREILAEETMQKCKNEERFCLKGDKPECYTNRKLAKRLFDIYLFFTNGMKLRDFYPIVKESFDTCKAAMDNLERLKYSLETKQNLKMCPYCGKRENEFMREIVSHKTRCKLEHQGCDCNVVFKTPNEKRRHMKLFHSDQKYFECQLCPFITLSTKTLDNHITYNHGNPGQEEACDLCDKTFKAINYLRIHRFSHECYFCSICNIEIMGRNPHKSHNMKVHKAGFRCDQCSKKFYTKKELEVHKHEEHSQIWKT